MLGLFLLFALPLLFMAGCVEEITGRDEVRSQCAEQLSACQRNCDEQSSLFTSVEECKNRCSNDYQTCLS